MVNTYAEIENQIYDTKEITRPADRVFRTAWTTPVGGVVAVDMNQAREVWRDKIRGVRAPVLVELDAEYMKALEAGDAVLQTDISAQKQALRDAPADPAIETAQTPEDLKLVQPQGLTIE